MTDDQIQAVRASFGRIYRHRAAVGRHFSTLLFLRAPNLRHLFGAGIAPQHARLAQMLAFAVRNLGNAHHLQQVLAETGRRHVGYGAEPEDFVTIGVALMDALRHETPDGLTLREDEAWSLAIFTLSGLMISAMYETAEA